MRLASKSSLVGWGVVALGAVVALVGSVALRPNPISRALSGAIESARDDDSETVVRTDDAEVPLVADRLDQKMPAFDPARVDRRSLGDRQVNGSAAVIALDAPALFKPEARDRPLAPSYAAALRAAGDDFLPSLNLIDGKAKQFDDGLYAAIDRAYYAGDPALGPAILGHRALLERWLARVEPGSKAADYLAAGLSLDPAHPPTTSLSPRALGQVAAFLKDEVRSKPIAFYTWDATLSACFRVLRFFAQDVSDPDLVAGLAGPLGADADLLDRYRRATSFYGRLTNPLAVTSLAEFAADPARVLRPGETVAVFPPSTSREAVLFERAFPQGPPANAQLMRALVEAIRSGRLDLAPDARSGWYEYQAFALEPLLLPERGPGADHLLLSRDYKKRALLAFEALLTKRRETHARQMKLAVGAMPSEPQAEPIRPRLRVEPNPGYYLRTARSYAFLAGFLDSTLGGPALDALHGLRQDGPRPEALGPELRVMRDLFLGLALLSSEDIGHRLELAGDEESRRDAAEQRAAAWLDRIRSDPAADVDLAADTRVAVPIMVTPRSGKVRLWATIGVALTPLRASYARPPRVRPAAGGDWAEAARGELEASSQLIAVDEFAEVELGGGRVLTRDELRAACDAHKTGDAIRQALGAIR